RCVSSTLSLLERRPLPGDLEPQRFRWLRSARIAEGVADIGPFLEPLAGREGLWRLPFGLHRDGAVEDIDIPGRHPSVCPARGAWGNPRNARVCFGPWGDRDGRVILPHEPLVSCLPLHARHPGLQHVGPRDEALLRREDLQPDDAVHEAHGTGHPKDTHHSSHTSLLLLMVSTPEVRWL